MLVERKVRVPRADVRGLTLIELVMAMTVLAIGLAGYAKTVAMASIAASSSREATLATEAGRQMIETLRATTYAQIFARYNSSTLDDIGGITNPGANFAVAGLDARANDVDGMPGEIEFPTTLVGTALQLREDVVNTKLGTPTDLSGDGIVDNANHAANYQNLPVLVRVRWRGVAGPGQVEFQTVLGNF